jgi:L-lactate utilization protein LutB
VLELEVLVRELTGQLHSMYAAVISGADESRDIQGCLVAKGGADRTETHLVAVDGLSAGSVALGEVTTLDPD